MKRDLWNWASDAACNQQAKFKDDLVVNGEKWPLIFPEKLKGVH